MFFREQYKPIPLVYNLVLAMLWRHPENVQLEKVKVVLRDRSHGGSRAKRRTWTGRCGRRGRTSGSRLERRKAAGEGDVAGGDGPRGSRFERRKSVGEGAAAGGDGCRSCGWRGRTPEGRSLAEESLGGGAEEGRSLAEGGIARRKTTLTLNRFLCHPELEAGNRITLPASCPSMSSKGCQSASFQLIGDSITCHDYQEIKIQESVQLLDVGSIPRSMPVILMDDLVDLVKAGDDVIVTGILSAKWSSDVKDVRCNLDPMFIANYVRRTNELKSGIDIPEEIIKDFELFWAENRATPLEGRNKILKGICPQICGLFTVKLAVALTLIGGVQHVDASGTKVRGEPHMLLVGDPGTGKSQFLKFAAKLSNRSVITTGLGSTSAGLTVTAVKDGGEWMLEAGALVLADGGLCCIDEFDSMREHDRTTIHEAMEQQTISVAKAGLVTTLSTRTTVFGATNPKGQYDSNESLSVNTTLSGPLLSRFDIVLVLLDIKDPKLDGIISSHILAQSTTAEENKTSDAVVKSTQPLGIKEWTLPRLRRYIHYVKQRFKPVLTKEAERVLSGYYQLQRRDGTHNAARTTVRMLESLIRLAQAHTRLMFRNEVTRLDAIAAILCIESSMTISAIIDGAGNALYSNFQENPDQEYIKEEENILDKLGDYLY